MISAFRNVVIVGLLLCGCTPVGHPPDPVKGSRQLSDHWESASIDEHALILTPLKIADEAPETYRRLLAASRHTADSDGREILSVARDENCPEHQFILDRPAGVITTLVKIAGFQSIPHRLVYRRDPDGWRHVQLRTPLTTRAERFMASDRPLPPSLK